MAKQDLNEQTAIDMANARKSTLVSVENLRDFLHSKHSNELPLSDHFHHSNIGGRDVWEEKQKIVGILETDPVFNKSRRSTNFVVDD
jgi:acyl-CoA oxidase